MSRCESATRPTASFLPHRVDAYYHWFSRSAALKAAHVAKGACVHENHGCRRRICGRTTAQRLAEKNLGDIVLHDIVEGMPQGKALDMMQSACLESFDSDVKGTNDPADYAGSDIVVITSGLARQPGMSRDDLLMKNAEIVGGVAENVKKYAPDAIVIVVSNPLDVMTYLVGAKTGFPQGARHGHGRRARFRALPLLHRAWNLASRTRTWRPWCSAATATTWCRSPATPPSPASASRRCCRRRRSRR